MSDPLTRGKSGGTLVQRTRVSKRELDWSTKPAPGSVWFDDEDHKTKIYDGKTWIAREETLDAARDSKKAERHKLMREEYATKMRDLAERTRHGEPGFEVIHGMDGIPRMVKR